jgi:hypothetical protein
MNCSSHSTCPSSLFRPTNENRGGAGLSDWCIGLFREATCAKTSGWKIIGSSQLNPPVKWSYRKLILRWALMFLSIGWILFYINSFIKHSSAVLSPPLILFFRIAVVILLLLVVLFWRHNQFAYKRRYSQWERSFLCQRCGTLTEQE